MITQPQPSRYRPDPAINDIADIIGDPVRAAAFPEHRLRFRNRRWDGAVGLDSLDDAQWIDHFGRFAPLPDNLPQPLALRYHGHQFRHYNPDLGDGRGFLFAQLRDGHGRLLDLGTKGSGQTPYSRFGDGRLTLKGGVREILATEMLEALGVETSKTFSLIETGEQLHRGDEPSPTRSAVMVRLSHGHIRIGSFQRLAALRDAAAMTRLADYALATYFGEAPGEDAAPRLLGHVVRGTARLAASYMTAGFVHGVLNTDNINITAESFDYGPWRFTPTWEPGFTAAYFDENGLYAFGRQPQAIHWNAAQLATALLTIAPVDALAPMLDLFPAAYEAALCEALLARLNVKPRGERDDLALVGAIETALAGTGIGIDRFFFDWRDGHNRRAGDQGGPEADFARLIAAYAPVAPSRHDYWDDAAPCSLHIDEVEAIWADIATADDWTRFDAKLAAIRRMGDAMRESHA
jgi:uncharacterized protein YdiU (UPF0061 family)